MTTTGCTGTAVGCRVLTPSVTVPAGGVGTASLRYKAGSSGTRGQLQLSAVQVGNASVTDQATDSVVAIIPSALQLAITDAGSEVDRPSCVIAAVSSGAVECGDLRLAHALPSVRTLNRSRAPTLVYVSQHAHPYALIPMRVTLPAGAPIPDTIVATLSINGVQVAQRWAGADFGTAATRRLVFGWDALTVATGLYPYTLQVSAQYGTTRYSSVQKSGYWPS